MLFNSIHFLIFFPIVLLLYFQTRPKYRWIILLISSYYFYMSWKLEYIILIIISTLVDYFAAWRIYKSKSRLAKRHFLFLSLFANLGLLFAFKYFNFFSDSFRALMNTFAIQLNPFTLKVLLPVGISFYTFQTLSYTIDVYRGKIKPEKHLGIFAVYVSFFPQLVAGPIERAKNLLPQLNENHSFSYDRLISGLRLMLWGFFKKVVVADRTAVVVNMIFNSPSDYSGIMFIFGTIFFAVQIFCDFSGYSDIAIGSARIMGIDLMKNFDLPYMAKSIGEFWKRWHISLSTWFKDYVYIPLGGNRVSERRLYLNLFTVFLVSGLWHGANWTFVIWGALHGFYSMIGRLTNRFRSRLKNFIGLKGWIDSLLKMFLTFILVNIGWIFFRANSVQDAFKILMQIITNSSLPNFQVELQVLGLIPFLLALGSLALLTVLYYLKKWEQCSESNWIKIISPAIMILVILMFGVFQKIEFIYFQF